MVVFLSAKASAKITEYPHGKIEFHCFGMKYAATYFIPLFLQYAT